MPKRNRLSNNKCRTDFVEHCQILEYAYGKRIGKLTMRNEVAYAIKSLWNI